EKLHLLRRLLPEHFDRDVHRIGERGIAVLEAHEPGSRRNLLAHGLRRLDLLPGEGLTNEVRTSEALHELLSRVDGAVDVTSDVTRRVRGAIKVAFRRRHEPLLAGPLLSSHLGYRQHG